MIVLYIAIALLSVMGIGWRRDEGRDQSLSIEQCNAIKGISILLVLSRMRINMLESVVTPMTYWVTTCF